MTLYIHEPNRTSRDTDFRPMVRYTAEPLNLASFEAFFAHSWIRDIFAQCRRQQLILASHAVSRLVYDLEVINRMYIDQHGRTLFTSVQGRVKEEMSLFKKLYGLCVIRGQSQGLSYEIIQSIFSEIRDIAGVRFSCPYYDEIRSAIRDFVRPKLRELSYAVDLSGESGLADKDLIDSGDEYGYRSYHFFVKVPTPTDIFGNVSLCLAELQARTELQHVWAVKSHDLLYKPQEGWQLADPHVIEDMRQVSNSLRAADQFLLSIRDRVRKIS